MQWHCCCSKMRSPGAEKTSSRSEVNVRTRQQSARTRKAILLFCHLHSKTLAVVLGTRSGISSGCQRHAERARLARFDFFQCFSNTLTRNLEALLLFAVVLHCERGLAG